MLDMKLIRRVPWSARGSLAKRWLASIGVAKFELAIVNVLRLKSMHNDRSQGLFDLLKRLVKNL